MRQILFFYFIFTLLSGCSHFAPESVKKDKEVIINKQIFAAPYDKVWRAAQIVIAHYSIEINNMDLGVIETQFIKGPDGWHSPHIEKKYSGGYRYKISLRIIKGQLRGQDAVQVIALKTPEVKRDFFSTTEKIESDGLEEKSILYRIARELEIEQAIEKAQKKKQETIQEG